MKLYDIIPNFTFSVEAENETEANAIAYDLLKEMSKLKYFDFDFQTEEVK